MSKYATPGHTLTPAQRKARKRWKEGQSPDEFDVDQRSQVRPHHGFKATALAGARKGFVGEPEERTPIMAKPPGWTETAKPCDPPANLLSPDEQRIWMDMWDLSRGQGDERATELCSGCPVIEQCLSAALEEEVGMAAQYVFLVRGGMTPKARVALAKQESA